MITEQVIREIYRKNRKPPRDLNDLNLPDALFKLKEHHKLSIDNEDLTKAEIILENLEEMNPFRRFLVRSLNAVLEFDKMYAFVFNHHILFLSKIDNGLRVHFKPEDEEEKPSIFSRIFGRK